MIFKIRITASAQREIRETYKYIAEDLKNPEAAERRVNLIDEKIKSLKDNLARYPLVSDNYLASKGFRKVIAKNHIIFYIIREKEQAVSIMRILYARRDWARLLKVEEED